MKAFLRIFSKRKSYYLVNILGLAIGLASVGFSTLYLQHELTYDSFHSKSDKIYRISYQDDSGWFASLHRKYVSALMQDTIPEIEDIARVRRWHSKFVFVGDEKFYESNVLITDPATHFFDLFDFPFVEGVASKALDQPNSVVISSSLAKKYFGDVPAVGKDILYDTMALTVTGVFKDLPTNTTFTFDMLIANETAMNMANGFFTFVVLNENTHVQKLESKIFSAPIDDKYHNMKGIKILPLRDLHFDANFTYEMKAGSDRSYLWILGAIGATIMLIAFTNFINLSVALYARRSREIAVRKSVGASSALLSKLFYFESVITIGVAFILSLILIYTLMSPLNQLLELKLADPLTSLPFAITTLILLPLISILACIYPSVVLPRIHILDLFKQVGITTYHGMRLRMLLLGFQLTVLFIVCCALWIIYGQFSYIRNKDLGFRKEGVIKIRRAWEVDSAHYQTMKTELLRHTIIKSVSQGYTPGDEDYGVTYKGDNNEEVKEGVLAQVTDYDYLSVLEIHSDLNKLQRKSVVINETLAKQLGYEKPAGRRITLDPGLKHEETYTIDGVVSDYHFNSLHQSIAPQILFLYKQSPFVVENILIKIDPANVVEAVDLIQSKINAIIPNIPVEISFLDNDLENLYKQETRLSKVVIILVSVSLVLSLVGLVALCSYMIEFRMREIAIRKVMGATSSSIIALFTKVFLKATLVAFAIGAPACYPLMIKWLEGFAYRKEINITSFISVLTIIMTIVVALSVSQTIKRANVNPSTILKE